MGTVVDFFRGIGHGFGGLGIVIGRRRMWPLVAWPFVIALGALVGFVVALVVTRDRWMALLPGAGVVHIVESVAAWLLVPIVCWFLFLPLAAAIAGPWNDSISEAVEEMTTGRKAPPRTGGSFLGDLGRTISQELRKFIRYLVLAVGIAIAVVVIPVVGPVIGIVGGGYIAARFAAFDSLDAALSRWG